MIYTSYFANWRKFPENCLQICIARIPPKGFNGSIMQELAPSLKLLGNFKDGIVNEEEYKKIFFDQINSLDKDSILSTINNLMEFKGTENAVLLCYEKKGDFCHRHLVGEWLEIKEL